MNPREIALALAVTSVIADAAAAKKDELRHLLRIALDDVGADSVRAELPTGERVAKSSIVVPKPKPTVVDETAFTAYVAEESPHNVEVRTTIRPAYQKLLLESLQPGPDGTAVDRDGVIVPGVTFRDGSAYVSTRFEKDGRDAVIAALRAGQVALDLSDVPALEPATK